jgi:proteasome lid subunit RPN8/RPN11
MSDHEIQFGDMEQARYQQHLPPNRNKQYAVAACGRPGAHDLRVFVDLDAARDMETHALSDTHVELGGVLLGGQYQDKDGEPFVVVRDSLRARHYQATRGSFKFTHDTWSEITRQRDEFPDDLHMVGWYHTHPDWGVFLSGMDMFICDHFFNGELDVALVIDPCRGDRGWFQWTGSAEDRIRRTGGFYLFTSRHRGTELELFAAHLENKPMTINDPRTGGFSAAATPYPVTAGSGYEPRQPWIPLAAMGMICAQFFLLTILAWKVFVPDLNSTGGAPSMEQIAAQRGAQRQSDDSATERREREVQAQLRVLDRVVSQLGDGTPGNLVRLLEQAERENEALKADARVYRSLEARVASENEQLTRVIDQAKLEVRDLNARIDELEAEVLVQQRTEKQYAKQVAELQRELKDSGEQDGDADLASQFRDPKLWLWGLAGAIVGGLAVVGVIVFRPRSEDDDAAFDAPEPARQEVDEKDGKSSRAAANNESDEPAS